MREDGPQEKAVPANNITLLVRRKAVLGTLSVQCAWTAAPAEPCLLFQFVMHDLSFCHLFRTLGTSQHKKKLKHNTDESPLYWSLDL